MTGAVQAAAGAAAASFGNTITKSVTMGTDGSAQFGFSNGSYGSISDSSLRGTTITAMRSSGVSSFGVVVADTGATAALFNRVLVEDTSGTVRTYRMADASIGGGIFAWGNGSDKAWTSTSPSPRSVTFYY